MNIDEDFFPGTQTDNLSFKGTENKIKATRLMQCSVGRQNLSLSPVSIMSEI